MSKGNPQFTTTDTGVASYLRLKGFNRYEVIPDGRQCSIVFSADDYDSLMQAVSEFRSRSGDALIAREMLSAYQEIIRDIKISSNR